MLQVLSSMLNGVIYDRISLHLFFVRARVRAESGISLEWLRISNKPGV